ncbi:MAG: LysR family transcriptional regulator [Rhizobiales bacterium]|nr:LysR family transcriptional regulator [Hyphomicrobiales bacterium]
MRYTQLSTLVAVVDAGGIRAGARKLMISQAAVTRALKQLESEVGLALVTRGARGVTLTQHGQRIYERASIVAEQMKRLDDEVASMRTRGTHALTFNVGAVIAATILPDILKKFNRQWPDIRVAIGEGTIDSALSKMRNGSMDFMIALTTGVALGKEMVVKPILRTGMRVVAGRNHPYGNAASLRELLSAKWIITPDDEMEAGGTHHIFAEHGLPMPQDTALCLSSSIGVSVVCQGERIAAMAEPFLRLPHIRDAVSEIELDEKLAPVTYSIIYRGDIPVPPAVQSLERLFHRGFPEWGWSKVA